jgi:hypothetical protein
MVQFSFPLTNVVRRSRQLWVKIKRDHPMRFIFYHAMDALR